MTLALWSQLDRIKSLINPDIIRVELHGQLKQSDVDVYWKGEADQDSILVYKSGQQLQKSFLKIGHNRFSVICRGEYLGSIEHFKTDQYNSHTYYYTIEEASGVVNLISARIIGPDAHR
jgi:hypothetical protein